MKRILYSLLAGATLAFTACESKMDEKHTDPDAFTWGEIPYLFSQGALNAIENGYGDMYTYNFRRFGVYLQTTAQEEGENRINLYQNIQNDLGRWENYYESRMNTLTEIDKIYATLEEDKQAKYRLFVEAGRVLKAYNTAIATDYFGAMPYSEAFTARNAIYGGTVILKPKYDSQQTIYYALLDDLKAAATYFASAESNETFQLQDILYQGDCHKWRRFANSLRLRYAMRISNVDPSKAKAVLAELPLEQLILDNADNACIRVSGQETAPDGIWRAMRESHSTQQGYYMYAPEKMVNLFKAAQDPRLVVYFQPATNDEGDVIDAGAEILGFPASADKAIALRNGVDGNRLDSIYGCLNTITFRKNYQLPVGIGMTAAETCFCLAEAAQRGLLAGDAESYYNKGILLSIQNYYGYYQASDAAGKSDAILNRDVSDEVLGQWLATSPYKFDAAKALEQIATQKWIHLGFLQIFENWAEYRRTDLPVLEDDRENGNLLNKENAPVRLLYPAKEASMNTANYDAQAADNKIDAHLWWDTH